MTLLDSSLFSSFSIHTINNNNGSSGDASYSPTPANTRACLACRMAHKSCDRGKPCSRCISRGISHLCCEPSTKKRGRPRKWKDGEQQQQEYNSENFGANFESTSAANMSPVTQSDASNAQLSNSSSSASSPNMYNVVPSSTCKSPVEEALLTETLKKTQSKKLKFIKIMNYNPNHRETFSPRFTITSSEKKHTLDNPQESSQKKRKTKSTNTTSTTNFALSYQTSTVNSQPSQPSQQFNIETNQVSSVSSAPSQFSIPIYPQTSLPTYSYFQDNQNQFNTALSNNQPRHCDEGRNVNNQVKLPSIYSLLSSLQQQEE